MAVKGEDPQGEIHLVGEDLLNGGTHQEEGLSHQGEVSMWDILQVKDILEDDVILREGQTARREMTMLGIKIDILFQILTRIVLIVDKEDGHAVDTGE